MITIAKTFCRLAMLGVPAICIAPPVLAADTGFYLGARLGFAQYPTKSRLALSPSLDLRGKTEDNKDLTWNFDVGYRFNRYVGIEAGYVDLGEASGQLTDGLGTAAAQTRLTVKGEPP